MNENPVTDPVVFTDKARCRDCYRCLRACPVKAIQMHDGQASVVAERCIACGTCIRECPQGAKSFRNDIDRAVRLIRQGQAVAASIAPSFAALWTAWERKRLPSALRKLGFAYVGETSIGAYPVARATAEYAADHPEQSHICTACPAVVNYVERYQTDLVDLLAPIVSPMLAHARMIHERLGPETRVVFIGPCVAKKLEAQRQEYTGLVDCVLTFSELADWLEREGIEIARCEESAFDETPAGEARFFPLPGGLARTAALETDLLAVRTQAVSGFDQVSALLDCARRTSHPMTIEPLMCPQGCVGGPGMPEGTNLFTCRDELIRFAEDHPGAAAKEGVVEIPRREEFKPAPLEEAEITEEAIREVLARTGKALPEDMLNCGACGYPTCREKAIAVLRGMAELEMCIPYMRRLAEQRTDRIIETSPNGIVILDEALTILHMNPAFRGMFMCSEAVLGKRISYLMDPEPFERLATGDKGQVEMTMHHPNYNLICHEILYPLREDGQFVGIFVNVTSSINNRKDLEDLRAQTQAQARELMEHQIQMAQQIAKLLGESTAQGEQLVKNILRLAGENEESGGRHWLWDMYTSR